MKRCDLCRKLYFKRISRDRCRRRLRGRRKKKLLNRKYCDFLQISAPAEFNLMDTGKRKTLLNFLKKIRDVTVKQNKCVLIDFSGTRRMLAAGTLLFRAELHRLIKALPFSIKLRCMPPHNARASEVLTQVGIYDLLNYKNKISPQLPDVINWRVAVGAGAVGEKYDDILGSYDGIISGRLQEGLYLGLTEAMTNAQHHAYLEPRKDGLNLQSEDKDWWMFSQEKDNMLYVVFCDLGVGIPETLPQLHPSVWDRLKSKVGLPLDSQIIAEAVKESRTRTHKHFRGKGLKQLVSVIESSNDGVVVIHSNRGCYTIRGNKESLINFNDSILGTIITWSLPITSEV